MEKKGRVGIIITVIVIILILVGVAGYYLWSNNETRLRGIIEEEYYTRQIIGFRSANYQGFESKENAENAVRCMSVKLSELVKKEDLKMISKEMQKSESTASTLSNYLKHEGGYSNSELVNMMENCLAQYGYSGESLF